MLDSLMIVPSSTSSKDDFDFIMGKWRVHHRKLKTRLRGKSDWIEFDGTAEAFKILDGFGNMKRYSHRLNGVSFEGIALRVFNPRTRLWTIYWIDTATFALDVPVVGSFDGKVGRFYSRDMYEGKEIVIRYTYDATGRDVVVWDQAFSPDGGTNWEMNWVMTAKRVNERVAALPRRRSRSSARSRR